MQLVYAPQAAPQAPPPPAPQALPRALERARPVQGGDQPERRKDPSSKWGKTYTLAQFLDFYGKAAGARVWAQAGAKKEQYKEKPKGQQHKAKGV